MIDHDSREIWYPDENPKMSMVYVGPNNDIPLPKFDPKIIEKYNNLNIQGKLPQVVESEYNPVIAYEQIKDLFKN